MVLEKAYRGACVKTVHYAGVLMAVGLMANCTDEYNLPNLSPEVEATNYCQQDGRTYIVVDVYDLERDPIDLRVEIGEGVGGCVGPMRVGPTGSGTVGLNSERRSQTQGSVSQRPQTHFIEWAGEEAEGSVCDPNSEVTTCCALPAEAPAEIQLTLQATDSDDEVESQWTGTLPLNEMPCDRLVEMADAGVEADMGAEADMAVE